MDPGDALRLLILIILIALSAFFSSSETALIGVSRIRIKTLADKGNKRALLVQKLFDMQPKMLSSILIGNNIVNLSASSLATVLMTKFAASWGLGRNIGAAIGISTGVLTLLILIFGEITPKNIAAYKAEQMALSVAPVIYWLTKILTPVIFIINKLSYAVMYIFGIRDISKRSMMTEGDFRTVLDVSHREGVLEYEEKELITNVVDFGDSVVSSVMVPRIDVTFLDADSSYEEAVALFREEKYARIPVYEDDKDHIIGILNLKDLFCYEDKPENFRLRSIMRKPFFTYEFKKTSDLLIEMRKSSISMAIVLDEYGAVSGIITLEDLLEEIVGEIRDEYDEEERDDIIKIGEGQFLMDGNTKLDDINELLGTELYSDDYDSIAGHMMHELGHIPSEDEQISVDGIVFTVQKMDRHRIDTILVKNTSDQK